MRSQPRGPFREIYISSFKGPMRDTIMKLKTLKRILKTYLSNHCEMCKGTPWLFI